MPAVGLVLLAAGGSTRMGTAKQLLPYAGKTLLRRAAETALDSRCRPVVVVLGGEAERFAPELDGLPVCLVQNADWEQGMGTSLHAGLKALLAETAYEQEQDAVEVGQEVKTGPMEAVVFMLCDQPLLSADILDALVEAHRTTAKPVAACVYGDSPGVPALFHRSLFEELLRLPGSTGAKPLLQRYRAQTASVPFPAGITDVDTPADYAHLLSTERSLDR